MNNISDITLPSLTNCPFCHIELKRDTIIWSYDMQSSEYILFCPYNETSNCSKYEAFYNTAKADTPLSIGIYFAHYKLTINDNNTWELSSYYNNFPTTINHGSNALELFGNLDAEKLKEAIQTIILYT